jgi:glycine oxidase
MIRVHDVAIVGGGVIGLTTAYYLAKDGVRVAVVDKGELGQEASWAGAGIVSPGNPKRATSPLGRLKAFSANLYPELSAELREQTGIDNGYRRCGSLELRCSADELEKRRVESVVQEGRGEGLTCDVLDDKQLFALERRLNYDLPGAICFPDVAQVRNPRHVKALVAACANHNVAFYRSSHVHDFESEGGRVTALRCAEETIHAARVLLAAGAWSGGLGRTLGLELPVRPIRGQIVLLNTGQPLLRHVLQAGSEYVVPRPDGRVLVGSTEEDAGFRKVTTAAGVSGLLRFAQRLVPALASAEVERCWAGLRPGSLDGRPYLGPVPRWDNVFVATGHFRSGIMLSPATGRVMADVIQGKEPAVPLDAFRVDRPPRSNGAALRANQE